MTQICIQCQNDVPDYAKTCKYCFQDLTSPPARKFPIGLAIGVFIVSLLAMFGTEHLASSQVIKRYNLFPESQSLLIVSSSREGISSDRIPFSQIEHLEHIQGGESHTFEIVAVTKKGDRILLQGDDKSLTRQVKDMADKTDLFVKQINNQKGI